MHFWPASILFMATFFAGVSSECAVVQPARQSPAASVAPAPPAPYPQLVAVRVRIRQLEAELALNASAQRDNSLTEQQRQGLQARAAQLGNELSGLRAQEQVLAR